MKKNAYQIEFTELLEELQTSEAWISSKEANQRNELYWPNAIQSKDKNSALKIFLEQFTSPLVIRETIRIRWKSRNSASIAERWLSIKKRNKIRF